MKHFKIILIISACILSVASGFAQPYQIRIVNRGAGLMSVEIRPTAGIAPGITDRVTDIVFGIKWSAAYDADLSDSVTNYRIRKSGTRSLSGSFHYQAFYSETGDGFFFPAPMAIMVWTEILSIKNSQGPTGTFAIAEPGFDLTTDPNIIINLTQYTPEIFNGPAILPVTLTSFNAMPDNKQIKLQWTVQNEQNSKGYEIQRSQTETGDFTTVGWVDSKATGNSSISYLFADKNVLPKVKYRYRLKQVDNDGKFSYSSVKTASISAAGNDAMQIFPNPVANTLQVYFTIDLPQNAMLKIIDVKGAIVQSQNVSIESGKKIAINTSGMPAGNYYLVVDAGNGTRYKTGFQKM